MNAQWLLSWWNLVFLLPFGLAAVYLAVYALTGITFGDADADVDHDYDHDVDHDFDADADGDVHADADVDADVDVNADVDADADIDADADVDAHADAHAHAHLPSGGGDVSMPMAVLTWFGVGRVPLSILFMVLFFTWGGVGFIVNNSLREQMGGTWRVATYSLPAAALAGVLVTRIVGRLITRYIPLNETYARRRHELLGAVGEAIFEITPEFGMASVKDDRGNLFHVPCRVAGGAGESPGAVIPKGAKVKLVAYNGKLKLFLVISDPAAPASGSRGPDGAKAVA